MQEREDTEGRNIGRDAKYTLDPFTALVKTVEAQDDRIKILEKVVFGFCALVIVAIVGAFIKLVVK